MDPAKFTVSHMWPPVAAFVQGNGDRHAQAAAGQPPGGPLDWVLGNPNAGSTRNQSGAISELDWGLKPYTQALRVMLDPTMWNARTLEMMPLWLTEFGARVEPVTPDNKIDRSPRDEQALAKPVLQAINQMLGRP
jgi:hypothetical protein